MSAKQHRRRDYGLRAPQLRPFEDTSNLIRVVIEAQKGSRVKLKYDERSGVSMAEKVLPPGLVFPFDFGFIPSTRAEDGDPLDALVLSETGLPAMTVVLAKAIKIIECEQTWDRF